MMTFLSDAEIVQHLYMSQAIGAYLRGATTSPPSRRASSYPASVPNGRSSEGKSFINAFSSTRQIFSVMKPGDIVVVTPDGHYNEALIGEIAQPWSPDQTLSLTTFQNELVPVRKVKWLNVALSRRDFPVETAKRLQNQRAVTRIGDDLYESILRLVYSAFIWNNESKVDIYAPNYRHNDPLEPYNAAFIIKWALSAYNAHMLDEFEQFQSLPLEEAAARYFNPEYINSFSHSFNSPGRYKLIGSGGAVALTVAAFVALAISDDTQTIAQAQDAIVAEVRRVDVPSGSDVDEEEVAALVASLRAGPAEKLKTKYGRPARNELGATLDDRQEVRRARDVLAGN